MKLGIKCFLLLLIFLFYSIYGLYSVENKNKNSESVSAVNSEILSKYIFRLQENSYDNTNELVPVDKSEDNYSIKNDPFLKVFYVDKNNKIRKFIENSQFAEGGTHVLEYFKEDMEENGVLFI